MQLYSWLLWFYCFLFEVVLLRGDSWTADIPDSVVGLKGSCLIIPCRFSYPGEDRRTLQHTGMWFTDSEEKVYHSDASMIMSKFRQRTSLLGDLRDRDCSLKITSLQPNDKGRLTFRIEIKDFNNYSYLQSTVSVTIEDTAAKPVLSVEGDMRPGKQVTITCSVSHTCSSNPPTITWNHNGTVNVKSLIESMTTSSLSFTVIKSDNNKEIWCTAEFYGGIRSSSTTTLNVKYVPENVQVVALDTVMEGGSLEMTCSSDSNPHPHAYQWLTQNGALLTEGQKYTMKNISRHSEPVYCTATNTEGQNKSSFKHLNIIYASKSSEVICPDTVIKGGSLEMSCSSDSNPRPHAYQWFTQNGTLLAEGQNYTMENITRHAEPMYCIAISTQGQTKSKPKQINVVYAPEIKESSMCTLEETRIRCLCIVDSHPPSNIKMFGGGTSIELKGTDLHKHGSLTIVTLQMEQSPYTTVHCQASNSIENSTLMLRVPQRPFLIHSSLLYILITVVVCVVIVIILSVCIVKSRNRTQSAGIQPVRSEATGPSKSYAEGINTSLCPVYDGSQNVYGNMELEGEYSRFDDDGEYEETYANV